MTFFFRSGKILPSEASRQLYADRTCTIWAVSLRYAASDTARPVLLLGGRGGSAVDIEVVAPGTNRSVGRVLGNRDVEGRSAVSSS